MEGEISTDEAIRRLSKDFRSFFQLYRALNTPTLRDRLEDELGDTNRRLAYQMTTPDRSSRQISEAMEKLGYDTPASTIRLWQQEWIRQGLLRRVSARKRDRVFDLVELGIDIGADMSQIEK